MWPVACECYFFRKQILLDPSLPKLNQLEGIPDFIDEIPALFIGGLIPKEVVTGR
jgi:hypothetical protein